MFSGKKKKEQLQAKRQKKREKQHSVTRHQDTNADLEEVHKESRTDLKLEEYKYGQDRRGIRSVFKKEPEAELEARKRLNYSPLAYRQMMPPEGISCSHWFVVQTVEPMNTPLPLRFPLSAELPRRGWNVGEPANGDTEEGGRLMIAPEVEAIEAECFTAYLSSLDAQKPPPCFPDASVNIFERNIEVWRQLWRTVESSDVVLLVADARYPLLHLPLSLLRYISVEQRKPCVVVLNKMDLVPRACLEGWIAFLTEYFRVVGILPRDGGTCEAAPLVIKTFTASPSRVPTNETVTDVTLYTRRKKEKKRGHLYEALRDGQLRASRDEPSSEEEFHITENFKGVDRANRLLRSDKSDSRGFQTVSAMITDILDDCRVLGQRPSAERGLQNASSVHIGVVGHPNVGKSSLLNCIRGTKVVAVSATAGKTKHLQTIPIPEERIVLIDSPGIVFPAFGIPRQLQAIIGTHQVAQTRDPQSCVGYLAVHLPLEKLFGLRRPDGSSEDEEWCPYDFCEAYAIKRGFLVKHGKGTPDIHRASLAIIKEAFDGLIPLYFAPPAVHFISSPDFYEKIQPFLCLPVKIPEAQGPQ